MDDELVKQFAALFRGRRDAYGLRTGMTVKEPVGRSTYRAHLEGREAIGIFPVTDDGTCHFAAVDFDRVRGNFTPQEIDSLALHDAGLFMEQCDRFGLNRLWLERSRRKGCHVWVFFDGAVKAAEIRRVFSAALAAAGITQYELFPKQDTVYPELEPLVDKTLQDLRHLISSSPEGAGQLPAASASKEAERWNDSETVSGLRRTVRDGSQPDTLQDDMSRSSPWGVHARSTLLVEGWSRATGERLYRDLVTGPPYVRQQRGRFGASPGSESDARTAFDRGRNRASQGPQPSEQLTRQFADIVESRALAVAQIKSTPRFGNYLNLPYPGGNNDAGRQMMLDRATHAPVLLLDFLKLVERFPAGSLGLVLDELPEQQDSGPRSFGRVRVGGGGRSSWYPCTAPLLNVNLHDGGGRNELALVLARRLQASPLSGAAKAIYDQWNQGNTPPLSEHEADRTWDSAERYQGMFCEKVREWQGDESEVIRATCVESCAIHPSKGIGSYRRLRKEQTDPPTYYLAIGGEDTRLTANELWRHSELCRAVMTQIDRVVPPMKDARWRDILQQLLDDIQVLQVPAEMTPRGELWSAMCDWFSGSSEHEEDIEAKPVQRDEHIYFKLRGLGAFLRRQGLNPKRDVMWAVLKDRGGCNGTSRFAGVVHRVWWLPAVEFSEQTLQDEPFLDSRNALTRNARKISENDF